MHSLLLTNHTTTATILLARSRFSCTIYSLLARSCHTTHFFRLIPFLCSIYTFPLNLLIRCALYSPFSRVLLASPIRSTHYARFSCASLIPLARSYPFTHFFRLSSLLLHELVRCALYLFLLFTILVSCSISSLTRYSRIYHRTTLNWLICTLTHL